MELELRHLKVVCAIAELGSVTKAASALGLAQPALTAQLQRIERTLGGALFERDRRGARPTALGELVLNRARVVLPAVDGLRDEAARMAGAGTSELRFKIGTVGGPILGGLVDRLAVERPDVQLTTYTSHYADELASMVLAGRLDLALIGVCGNAGPPAAPGMVWREVAVEAVAVLLPATHPCASQCEVDLVDLADADLPVALPAVPPRMEPNPPRPAGMVDLTRRLDAADAIVIVTPDINSSYPASVKTAIDWHYTQWDRKAVGFVGYSGASGGLNAIAHLRQVFAELNAHTIRDYVSFPRYYQQFDAEGRWTAPSESEAAAAGMLDQLHWWASALAAARVAA